MSEPIQEDYPVIRRSEASRIPSLLTAYGDTNWSALILGGLLISVFLFCYLNVFIALVGQWLSVDIYSYGFLIPLISLYLVWIRRDKLARLRPSPNFAGGIPLLFAGLLLLLLGYAGAVELVQELSLIPTLAGVVLLLLGTKFFQTLCFPIAYLLFMIPVWEIITDRLHLPFQIFSATIAVKLLQFIGIPVYQQGKYIELPNITLEVARGCSGVNYLIAVIAIGIPLAYLFLKDWKRRATLVSFAVAVSILSNSLRVFLVGILAYYGIGGDIHGPYHVLQGLSVSVMGYGAIFLGLSILTSLPSTSLPLKEFTVASDDSSPFSPKRNIYFTALFACGLLVVAGSYLHFLYKPKPVPLTSDLESLPMKVGEWQSEHAVTFYHPYTELHVDRELSRIYYKNAEKMGQGVHLYIGYFETQEQNRELIYYKARSYFSNASMETVHLNNGEAIAVNKAIVGEGKESRLYLMWYNLNGHIVTNPYLAKFYTAWSGFTRAQTNGAVILISTEIREGDSQEGALARVEEFARQIFPLLSDYLPGN